jgi:CheY-like chemotaxis protein
LVITTLHPRNVLVVDDEVDVRSRTRLLLEDLGCHVSSAGSAEEALVLLNDGVWELVILDIRLPGISGLEALRQIRARNARLPVVICSGLPEDPYAAAAIRMGATRFVNKERAAEQLPDVLAGLV